MELTVETFNKTLKEQFEVFERRLEQRFDQKLDERDRRLEQRLDQKLDERDRRLEERLDQKLEQRLAETRSSIITWVVSLFIGSTLLMATLIGVYVNVILSMSGG